MHIIIIMYSTFKLIINLNTILPSYIQSYLLPTFIILLNFLYLIYLKFNGGLNGFIILLIKVFDFFLMLMSRIVSNIN
jgi:hypothetical protein